MERTVLLLLPLVLAACSAEPSKPDAVQPSQAVEQPQAPSTSIPSADDPLTSGGDGSPIRLTPLTAADRAANPLAGELGCGFAAGQDTLLIAMGNVGDTEGRAEGLVKIGDSTERLIARQTGGYDGLPDGAEFGTRGLTVTVSRSSDTPVSGGESPPYPAELLLQRADGAEQVIAGLWTCGP